MVEDEASDAIGPIAPERLPLIEPGEYVATCVKFEIFSYYSFNDTKKVHLHMEIEHPETGEIVRLMRFLNYYDPARINSDLFQEWVIVNDNKWPSRKDRMSLRHFVGKRLLVEVRTTTKDSKRRRRSGDRRYSKVSAIISLHKEGAR